MSPHSIIVCVTLHPLSVTQTNTNATAFHAPSPVCLMVLQRNFINIMPFNSNSRPGNPLQRYKFADDGRPICLRCDQAGHMARDCLTVQRQGPHVRNDFGQRTVNTGDVQSSGLPGN